MRLFGDIMVEFPGEDASLEGAVRRVLLTPPRIDWRQWVIRVTRGQTDLAKGKRRCIAAAVYACLVAREESFQCFGCVCLLVVTPSVLLSLKVATYIKLFVPSPCAVLELRRRGPLWA
ncbi:hypothetical protein Dimus_009558 [Dionaea muscipula]